MPGNFFPVFMKGAKILYSFSIFLPILLNTLLTELRNRVPVLSKYVHFFTTKLYTLTRIIPFFQITTTYRAYFSSNTQILRLLEEKRL